MCHLEQLLKFLARVQIGTTQTQTVLYLGILAQLGMIK